MSLVILSNDASESLLIPQRDSIFKPYSFRNSMTSTLEIPANAELALQSCKITLDGSVGLESGRRIFYINLGETITEDSSPGLVADRDSQQETLSTPLRMELFGNRGGVLDVSQEQIAEEISRLLHPRFVAADQNALRLAGRLPQYGGLFHPNYVSFDGQELSGALVKRGAGGESEGYTLNFKMRSQAENFLTSPANATQLAGQALDMCNKHMRLQIPLGGTATLAQPYAVAQAVNSVQFTPNAYRAETMGTTFNIGGISLFGGRADFDLTNVVGGGAASPRFCVGLSRVSTTPGTNAGTGVATNILQPRDFHPSAGKGWQAGVGASTQPAALQSDMRWCKSYFDFGIMLCADNTLRVVHTAAGDDTIAIGAGCGDEQDQPKMIIVDYTQAGRAPFNAHYDLRANAANFNNVRFETTGARVKIIMSGPGGGGTPAGDHTLIEFDAAYRAILDNLKPIDQCCWNLQPFMMINNDLPAVRAVANPAGNALFLSRYDVAVAGAAPFQGPDTQPSYYTMCMERNTAQSIAVYRDLSRRWKNMPLGNLPYYTTDAVAGNFGANGLRPSLIVAPSTTYTPTFDANTRELLGFANMTAEIDRIPPWVADVLAAGPPSITTQTLNSTVRPITVSTKSIFVRLDNFNQTTMNYGNGNPSRIISHLPRFDGQNETGRLFFEPSTLVYVDLHNPNPLKINQLDLSLVYGDESLCTALVGTTVIVLHIRPKKD